MTWRGQHWTDTPVEGRRRRRTIGNWRNFREQGGKWEECDPSPDPITGAPDGWLGSSTFSHYSRRGALQSALGVDVQGRPHAGVRRADRRDAWAEVVWLDGKPTTIEDQSQTTDRRIVYHGFAPQTKIGKTPGRGRLDKVIRLAAPGHPKSFRFALKLAPGLTQELVGQSIVVRDARGVGVLHTRPPASWDSSTIADTLDGKQAIGVPLARDGTTPQGDAIFSLTPDQDDLAGAVYPVDADPPWEISGTTDIEDAFIAAAPAYRDTKWGGSARGQVFYAGLDVPYDEVLFRVAAGAFPAGTITGFRLLAERLSDGASDKGDTMYLTRLLRPWVEADVTWNSYAHLAAWTAGGADDDGTDIDRANETTYVYAPFPSGGLRTETITLPPTWATNWRDAVWDPDGFKMWLLSPVWFSDLYWMRMTENSSTQPVFEVDYYTPSPVTILDGRRD